MHNSPDTVGRAALTNQVRSFYRDGTYASCKTEWKNTAECWRLVRLGEDEANVRDAVVLAALFFLLFL